ncbi:hypothetical protein BC830DRAFT_126411 [Chytriomyces sp. MP71]|nr:hypothetical protein BC830DRAFT_126411 [Chytriomyces sp. MP71]
MMLMIKESHQVLQSPLSPAALLASAMPPPPPPSSKHAFGLPAKRTISSLSTSSTNTILANTFSSFTQSMANVSAQTRRSFNAISSKITESVNSKKTSNKSVPPLVFGFGSSSNSNLSSGSSISSSSSSGNNNIFYANSSGKANVVARSSFTGSETSSMRSATPSSVGSCLQSHKHVRYSTDDMLSATRSSVSTASRSTKEPARDTSLYSRSSFSKSSSSYASSSASSMSCNASLHSRTSLSTSPKAPITNEEKSMFDDYNNLYLSNQQQAQQQFSLDSKSLYSLDRKSWLSKDEEAYQFRFDSQLQSQQIPAYCLQQPADMLQLPAFPSATSNDSLSLNAPPPVYGGNSANPFVTKSLEELFAVDQYSDQNIVKTELDQASISSTMEDMKLQQQYLWDWCNQTGGLFAATDGEDVSFLLNSFNTTASNNNMFPVLDADVSPALLLQMQHRHLESQIKYREHMEQYTDTNHSRSGSRSNVNLVSTQEQERQQQAMCRPQGLPESEPLPPYLGVTTPLQQSSSHLPPTQIATMQSKSMTNFSSQAVSAAFKLDMSRLHSQSQLFPPLNEHGNLPHSSEISISPSQDCKITSVLSLFEESGDNDAATAAALEALLTVKTGDMALPPPAYQNAPGNDMEWDF